MKLTNQQSRCHATVRQRVDAVLAAGCDCGGDAARLTKRLVASHVTIHMQCERCGRSLSGALPRSGFYFWQDFPEWDTALQDAYWAERRTALPSPIDHQQRRDEYAEWCATSPEWQKLRYQVLWRSRGHCEACLQQPATHVHHVTYSYGKLPPAWHLRAVCNACHNRLHNEEDEWCAIGMARQTVGNGDASE